MELSQLEREPATPRRTHAEGERAETKTQPTFETLWGIYSPRLFRSCLRWMSGRVGEAEEAFSRAGMLAFQKYPSHQHELAKPDHWLMRLTYNVCMDLHRELKRERAFKVTDLAIMETASGPAQSAHFASPERLVLRGELERFVLRSVRSLTPALREAAEPIFFEGSSYQEIAGRLGISQASLRKRVQQARSAMRRRLAAYAAGDGAPWRETPRLELAADRRCHPWSVVAPRCLETVQVQLGPGLERDVVLPLGKPLRQPTARRVENLLRYLDQHPTGWKRRLELARLMLILGRCTEALPHYQAAISRQPRRASLWLELADVQVVLGRQGEAVETWRNARLHAGLEASEQHLRGWIAGLGGDLASAASALAEAARLEPSNDAHPIALGRLFLMAGQAVEAAEAFDSALEIRPENSAALTLSQQALEAAGRSSEARRRAERAIELDSAAVLALEYLVGWRTRAMPVTGEEGRKTRDLVRLLESRSPRRAATQRCLAGFHLARGERDRAEREFAAYLIDHPGYPAAWQFYGQVLEAVGKPRLAHAAWRRASLLQATGWDSRHQVPTLEARPATARGEC